jgi:hypothetical protein
MTIVQQGDDALEKMDLEAEAQLKLLAREESLRSGIVLSWREICGGLAEVRRPGCQLAAVHGAPQGRAVPGDVLPCL